VLDILSGFLLNSEKSLLYLPREFLHFAVSTPLLLLAVKPRANAANAFS